MEILGGQSDSLYTFLQGCTEGWGFLFLLYDIWSFEISLIMLSSIGMAETLGDNITY